MAYLYRHIRKDKNEVFYIGIGSDTKYTRAYSKHNRNKYWKNITNKTSFKVDIILDNLSWEEACKKEIEFIKLYGRNSTGTLCNLTDGGDGSLGVIPTKETLLKRSVALSGVNNPMYGKKFSQEYRTKLSLAKLGKPRNKILMNKMHEVLRKKVMNIITNEMYNSINEAATITGVSPSTMSRWVNRKDKPYKLL